MMSTIATNPIRRNPVRARAARPVLGPVAAFAVGRDNPFGGWFQLLWTESEEGRWDQNIYSFVHLSVATMVK
jgi:hypothetical protein